MAHPSNDIISAGERAYAQWHASLLSTPEARRRYAEIAAEHALWLDLAEACRDAGLTRKALVKQGGIAQKYVKRIERGDFRHVPFVALVTYARTVGKSLRIKVENGSN